MAIANADGSIVLTTQVDQSGLKKGMSTMKSGVSSLIGSFGKLAAAIGVAFSVGAIVKFGKESSNLATTAEASVQRLIDIYGSASKAVGDFIDANAQALGMSRAAAASYASVYGNLFSVWADQSTNAELTNRYLNMTAVVASKTGRTVEDVQERIRSGLLGNTEAIEDLGIFVNVKTIEMTDAFQRMANGKSWEQLDAYTQQQIRSMAILEQATAKYGDEVAKTTALTKSQFQAAWQDFQATWGQVINKVLIPVLRVLTDILIKATSVMQTLFGISKTTISQSDAIGDAVENQKELTTEVNNTAKATKKALAGFDDIQILSSSAAEEDTVLPQISGDIGLPDISGDIGLPDISEKSGEMREEISQNIFGAFEDVIERLPEFIGKIVSMLPKLTEEIVSALPSLIQTILTSIVSLIPTVASGLTNAVVILLQSLPSIILPILVALPSIISTLLQTVVDNLPLVLDAVGDLISGLILALPEIIQALIVELPNIISLILQTILMATPQLINLVFDIVFALAQALPEILLSLIIAIPGALIGVWDAIVNFWKDYIAPIFTAEWWKNLGKTCINGLIAGFEGGINGIIWAFESMINWVVDGLNKISFDVPDWVPLIGGKTFGFDIPRASFGRVSIPRLAQGAVIPPNREFLAVLGDQKHGTNIEAPLQTIVDAFNIALSQNSAYNGRNTEVVLEIDGREFGRAVVEQGNRENRRIGTKLVIA